MYGLILVPSLVIIASSSSVALKLDDNKLYLAEEPVPILTIVYTCWEGFAYFFICAFFKTEPVLWLLSKLGFSETEI